MNGRVAPGTLRGLYAVTPDTVETDTLVAQVRAAIHGGAHVLQYRNKTATPELRLEQALALRSLCKETGVVFIINDHVELARTVEADGVHVGSDDAGIDKARRMLGSGKIIGVSCYNQLDLALSAEAHGADYVAFGSFFPSRVKAGAVRAPLDLLVQAKRKLKVPIAAIGGITIEGAAHLVAAGADALAVISAIFSSSDVAASAREFAVLFESPR